MIKYIVKYILLEAKKRGLNENLSWEKYNNILYGVKMDVDKEMFKYFKKRDK